jgi:tetratricopeptide (TPR) repeat protein
MFALAGAILVLALLAPLSWHQTKVWKNPEIFARHYVHIIPRSASAHSLLGESLAVQDRHSEAVVHLRQAIKLKPRLAQARSWLGNSLTGLNDLDGALREFQTALLINPDGPAFYNLARVHTLRGEFDQAIHAYRESQKLEPEYPVTHARLAELLSGQGKQDEADFHLQEAKRLDPNLAKQVEHRPETITPTNALEHARLGKVLSRQGHTEQAMFHFTEALRLDPNLPPCEVNFCK